MSNLTHHTRNAWTTATDRVLRLAPSASDEAARNLITQLSALLRPQIKPPAEQTTNPATHTAPHVKKPKKK